MKTVCIFTGGDILDYSKILVDENSTIICADSGIKHVKRLGLLPKLVIGDFDSFLGDIDFDCEIIRCIPEKDDTDTLMAVRYAIENGAEKIIIYGGLSGRLDHTIANIQTLLFCERLGIKAVINDGINKVTLQLNKTCLYPKEKNTYLSVFSMTESVVIKKLSGVKYPLLDYKMEQSFPIGVSNEIIDDNAYLEIEDGIAIIIYSQKDELKL